jgi:hypothetical protein
MIQESYMGLRLVATEASKSTGRGFDSLQLHQLL